MDRDDKPIKTPYLHFPPPRRVLNVGGEGEPVAEIRGNRAGLLRLRDQIDRALRVICSAGRFSAHRQASASATSPWSDSHQCSAREGHLQKLYTVASAGFLKNLSPVQQASATESTRSS